MFKKKEPSKGQPKHIEEAADIEVDRTGNPRELDGHGNQKFEMNGTGRPREELQGSPIMKRHDLPTKNNLSR